MPAMRTPSLRLYADDAVVMAPGAPPASGSAAIKQLIAKEIAGAKSGGVSLAQGKMNDVAVKGDMAWHAGTYSVIKDGKTVDTGGYMEVLRKKGGKWLIVRDIWNSSTPPHRLRLHRRRRHLLRLLRRRNS